MCFGFFVIGEIFKIYGCRLKFLLLIFNEVDYKKFEIDYKYLSVKFLIYFIEYLFVFVGYCVEDLNIKSVFVDVYYMVGVGFGFILNIYILEWDKILIDLFYFVCDKVLFVGEDVNICIKSICVSFFEWVFKVFGVQGNFEKVNIKLLCVFMVCVVEFVCSDILKK